MRHVDPRDVPLMRSRLREQMQRYVDEVFCRRSRRAMSNPNIYKPFQPAVRDRKQLFESLNVFVRARSERPHASARHCDEPVSIGKDEASITHWQELARGCFGIGEGRSAVYFMWGSSCAGLGQGRFIASAADQVAALQG